MLSKEKIKKLIEKSSLLKKEHKPASELYSQIQSSSVDLTIDRIYAGEQKIAKYNEDIEQHSLDIIYLQPGQTVVVQVAESFIMPEGLGGIIFPPNSMSKSGVIMTNPGHIDPNFQGMISVYLVNMGKREVRLKKGDKVATLLLFELTGVTELKNNLNGYGVEKDQVLSLSKDFANINERIPELINRYVKKHIVAWISLALAALTILLVAFPIATKIYFDTDFTENHIKNVDADIDKNKGLIETLNQSLKSKSDEIKVIQAGTIKDKSLIKDLEVRLKDNENEVEILNDKLDKLLLLNSGKAVSDKINTGIEKNLMEDG